MKVKKMIQTVDHKLVQTAKIALAAVEFTALAATGLVNAGGRGVKKLFAFTKKRPADQKVVLKPGKNMSDAKTVATERVELENMLASIDKRLQTLEKNFPYSTTGTSVLDNGKVAIDLERYILLMELATITKTYFKTPAK
ncbi:MAG TPA: hypothetical protein HPP94_07330 [Desulfuromonadales bacterium]|nr:hypothetical protein [Desulfuromonadales bacterium]